VAAALPGVQHHVLDISLEEALQELPECVRVLQSFDPMTLRNDIAGEWVPGSCGWVHGVRWCVWRFGLCMLTRSSKHAAASIMSHFSHHRKANYPMAPCWHTQPLQPPHTLQPPPPPHAVCRALREAAALGFTCAVTGDAADELFGGYNFTHRLDEAAWEHNRQRMASLMHFGSVPLGEAGTGRKGSLGGGGGMIESHGSWVERKCGMLLRSMECDAIWSCKRWAVGHGCLHASPGCPYAQPPILCFELAGQHFGLFVASPFNQPAVVQAAMQFTKADCVQPRPAQGVCTSSNSCGNGDVQQKVDASKAPEQQQQQPPPLLGKMPLRLAFPEVPTCWRGKDPIEVRRLTNKSCC